MKLTLPQQDIYFEQLLYPNEAIYNIGAKILILGTIDFANLQKAYAILLQQHDAYRSVIIKEDERSEIKILEEYDSKLDYLDFSGLGSPESEANKYMQTKFTEPFNIFGGEVLYRFALIKVEHQRYYLFSVYHHIITDGWGTSLMFQRLVQNYNEIYEFGEVKTEYSYSYEQFVLDDAEYEKSSTFMEDKTYWVSKFSNLPDNLFEKKNISRVENCSNRKELFIERELYNKLIEVSFKFKTSTFHLILALVYIYFGRKHRNGDFAIGLPVLNRNKAVYKKTVGLFMSISPLRISLELEHSFEELVNEIKDQLRKDYRHQRFPLGKLVQELRLFANKDRLFNITLSYEKQNYSADFRGSRSSVIPLSHQMERVALAIYIREFDDMEDVKIDFDYNRNYFDEIEINQVVEHFNILLNDVIQCPGKKLKDLNFLSESEIYQLAYQFNDTTNKYLEDETFLELFEKNVILFPNKLAIHDDVTYLSYEDLGKVSTRIAAYIDLNYAGQENAPIAVLLNRSSYMVAVLLGILKSGRAYIPLDPTFPKERLHYIINDSKAKLIISDHQSNLIEDYDVNVIQLDDILSKISDVIYSGSKRVSSDATAYIIYTSGSTGDPKGVEIRHRSLANFLISILKRPGIGPGDILFSVTTYSFDISILEFFAPIISGATLYIANQFILSDPKLIIRKLVEIQPTIIQGTPSFFQLLFSANWNGNKHMRIFCGGDLLSESLAKNLLEKCASVWNMYGPTESTIWSSIKRLNYSHEALNIGKPIDNTQIFILDEYLNLMPKGTIGGLYIAGDGLAKGYFGNQILTRKKFLKNQFKYSDLIYETGDLARWNHKGEIEFFGRTDNQVKLRGYRIELGDIECHLNNINGDGSAVVIAKKDKDGNPFLVAYILNSSKKLNSLDLISYLQLKVPHYMIPNAFAYLDKFPVTLNNKIDRKALSEVELPKSEKDLHYLIPGSDLERDLLKCWNKILFNLHPICVTDNFFALGGHSLNATKLNALILKELSLDITLKEIFDYPTVQLLARHIENRKYEIPSTIVKAKIRDFYSLTPMQYRIWVASQRLFDSISYNMSAAYAVEGALNLEKLVNAINVLIKKHEILRTNFIEINGMPFQKINSLDSVNLKATIHTLEDKTFDEIIDGIVNTPFNFENDLLIRLEYIRISVDNFILIFKTHHLILDGISIDVFVRDIIQNYNLDLGSDVQTGDTEIFQYKDYSEYISSKLSTDNQDERIYWEKYLGNYKFKNILGKNHTDNLKSHRLEQYEFEFTNEDTANLIDYAATNQLTVYSVILAALNNLIYRMFGAEDICIGTVNSGRNNLNLDNQIGMFAQTLIIRTIVEAGQTCLNLARNIHQDLLVKNKYQNIPNEIISKHIFDCMVIYQNSKTYLEGIIILDDVKLKPVTIRNRYPRMPFVFNLFQRHGSIKGIIEYNSNLYDVKSIKIIASNYCKLLIGMLKDPGAEIDLVSKDLVLENFEIFDFDFVF